MAIASQESIVVVRPLEGLLARLGVEEPAERDLFETLWQQMCRHAPLFGYADHPDVDSEHLELAQHAVHEELAAWARRGEARAVEQAAVRTMLSALRSARGLATAPPRPELADLLEPARVKLCAAARCRHVPLVELFHYNRSLDRHYSVQQQSFAELVDWCVEAIEHAHEASPSAEDRLGTLVRRFVEGMRQLEPAEPSLPDPEPGSGAGSELEPMSESPPVEPPPVEPEELPATIVDSPPALAELAAASAPEHDAEPGSGHPLVQRWYGLLRARLGELPRASAEDIGALRRLPPLVHSALLVHVLGLEDRRRKAVLSAAADHLLVHCLIPSAHAVGSKNNRHEPIAGLLVGVLATALRPWSFEAPPLRTEERVVIVALLAELATSKARKLLHEEKQHAHAHDDPPRLRAAVNRALARWPACVHEVSPKQRIDRVAAGMRYLSRVRRGSDPRARDLAIVAELLGH